ncbi:MAG: hypothetical protein ACI308_04890 [Muribaculaceae bacterium]
MKWYKMLMLLLPIAALTACGGKSEKAETTVDVDSINHSRFDEEMVRTAEDTLNVENLTKTYFRALQDKEFDRALGMLFSRHEDGSTQLTAAERKNLLSVYNSVPVYDFQIIDLKMYGELDTEVTVRVVMFAPRPGDDRPNHIDYKLHPCRIDGKWLLSVPLAFKETGDSVNNYDIQEVEIINKRLSEQQ